MKKLFLLFVALLATTSLWAYDFKSGDLYYNITSSSAPYTMEVRDAVWSITSAIIPETVTYNGTTYIVTSIGYAAFEDCRSLTSITIPNSVTSIGGSAFEYCSSLTSIVVETGNTTYDSRDNCNAIIETATNKLILGCQNTVIPSSVTSIEFAFQWCSSLKSIVIPDGVTIIGVCSFSECTSLEMVEIPKTVTEIQRYAFEECTALVSITYRGTMQEWEQIKKGDMWNFMVPAEVIHCVDGDIQNSADDTYNGGKVIKIHL